jgi:hypothetical protein
MCRIAPLLYPHEGCIAIKRSDKPNEDRGLSLASEGVGDVTLQAIFVKDPTTGSMMHATPLASPCRSNRERRAEIAPEVIKELRVINRGFLLRTNSFLSGYGLPSWTLQSIASLLGLIRSGLFRNLNESGIRFDPVERTAIY